MDPVLATLVILALAIIAFVINKLPLGIVAIGVALALLATGVLTLDEAFAGFGDPTVIFIAAVYVVSEALDATGVTAWAGQQLLARAGTTRTSLLLAIGALAAGLTALVSVTAAVAALLPLVIVVAARAGVPASKLLLPLAFISHAGSMLLLTGTPVNIIVSSAAADAGGRPFGFFEFALVGVPLLIATMLIVLIGAKLLPERAGLEMPLDLVRHARLLREQYAVGLETGMLLGPVRGITEAIVPPRSPLIGAKLTPGMRTPSGDLVLLAARRGDTRLNGTSFVAQAGDSLLLQGEWDMLEHHMTIGRVLPVDSPTHMRRSVPLGKGAVPTLVILGVMIVLLATGVVPAAVAALLAAGALVVTRTVTSQQAFRSISWSTVVLVAGMIPLSTAFLKTGAAALIADRLLELLGAAGPYAVLAAICALTIVLGQLISNTATVLILLPVAVALAGTMGLSVQPFMMALTVAGAASFLTPIATPANLMVMGPGGYRFGDYWKLGLPLALVFFAVAVFYVPLIWPFQA